MCGNAFCQIRLNWSNLLLCCWLALPAAAADWPTYRGDAARSGIAAEELTWPLARLWTYRCAQPPAPAWDEPTVMANSVDFDLAPAPVVAGGRLFFGSSADDSVRALDALTGRELWRFTAGGPVRLAPQVVGDRLYFGADDGVAYCLNAGTGQLLWTFDANPADERQLGNRRMISRWPVRTGVLVLDNRAYFAAGMWPAEGVYVYALDAASGAVVWLNDTCGWTGKYYNDQRTGNHLGEISIYGVVPQGALLAAGGVLLVPRGYTMPAAFDLDTGKLLWCDFADSFGVGGTRLTIDDDMFYALHRKKGGRDIQVFYVKNGKSAWDDRRKRYNLPKMEIPQLSPFAADMSLPELGPKDLSFIVRKGALTSAIALDLIAAGDTFIAGYDGCVRAFRGSEADVLWSGEVNGAARHLAVASGRLYAATTAGEIACFAPTAAANSTVAPAPVPAAAPPAGPQAEYAAAVATVAAAGMDRGFALVLGDPEARLSRQLAADTGLRVINALSDPAAVPALREELLDRTNLYGARLHVQALPPAASRLPFAQFFANAVVVGPGGLPPGLPPAELYRVLRPCGGVLFFTGAYQAARGTEFARQAGVPEKERHDLNGVAAIIRGALPGALDIGSAVERDLRVSWPLRPLWYGGIAAGQAMDLWGTESPPLVANGRYLMTGEDTLSAIDAYNGNTIWTRRLPPRAFNLLRLNGLVYQTETTRTAELKTDTTRALGISAGNAFLRLGKGYFKGRGEAAVRLAATTGGQELMYAPFIPPEIIAIPCARQLAEPAPGNAPELPAGSVTITATATALVLELNTLDAELTAADSWDLFLDCRPLPERYGLYGHGNLQVRVFPAGCGQAEARCEVLFGNLALPIQLQGRASAAGTSTIVSFDIAKLGQALGGRLDSVDLALTLNRYDSSGPRLPAPRGESDSVKLVQLRRIHLFGDAFAGGLNNGWARLALVPGADLATARPRVVAGEVSAMPKRWFGTGISPRLTNRGGKPLPPQTVPRRHPLTGELSPKVYRTGTFGCGKPTFSETAVFRRPGRGFGIYDFADDSGLRCFYGIQPSCSVNSVAALGLLNFVEARPGCVCTSPIRTSMAFAPAERRLNEDWAVFFAEPVDTLVRQAAINFGAFGDRRAADGTLWLCHPRTSTGRGFPLAPGGVEPHGHTVAPGVWIRALPASLEVPLAATGYSRFEPEIIIEPGRIHHRNLPRGPEFDELGSFRYNADRVVVAGTDKPWLYASGYRGVRRLEFTLDLRRPAATVAATAAVDGNAGEWTGEPQYFLPFTKTKVFLGHSDAALLVAAARPPVLDRRGKTVPWKGVPATPDAAVHTGDSVEIFLSDARQEAVLHLGLSATGARRDALAGGQSATEDAARDFTWDGAAAGTEAGLVAEFAIPWQTIAAAGLNRETLAFNLQVNQAAVSGAAFDTHQYGEADRTWTTDEPNSEAVCSLGAAGREHCAHFYPLGIGRLPAKTARRFTVRLHFAELEPENTAGQRVFDVRLQGQTVLEKFDIAAAAGGARRAVIREFPGIAATDKLEIELIAPSGVELDRHNAPMINAMELAEEK